MCYDVNFCDTDLNRTYDIFDEVVAEIRAVSAAGVYVAVGMSALIVAVLVYSRWHKAKTMLQTCQKLYDFDTTELTNEISRRQTLNKAFRSLCQATMNVKQVAEQVGSKVQ